jgi:putative membrane protein
MTTITSHLALPVALALAVCGCGGDQPAKSPETSAAESQPPANTDATLSVAQNDMPTASVDASTPSDAPTAAGATTPPVGDSTPGLTDAQILQVLHTANAGEIEQAKIARAKSKDVRVKKLAAMMLDDHTKTDKKGVALAKKAGLTPEPSPVSTSLETDAGGNTTTLKSDGAADFDKAYVDTQVKEHQAVLDLVDKQLIPSARNADLSALLAEVRPAIAMHLMHATELQTAMQK